MPIKKGFAAMDPEKQRQIASMGGREAHRKGRAHEFTSEEAVLAGRKGGLNRSKRGRMLDTEQKPLPGTVEK